MSDKNKKMNSTRRINNLKNYNRLLANGMEDKIWFATLVPADEIDTIIDYGCGDGTLMSIVHGMMPQMKYIGVDCSNEMLDAAREKCPFASLMTVEEYKETNLDVSKTMIVLSSVIHEIYSYSDNVDEDMNHIFGRGYRYIAIRDMFLDTSEFIACDNEEDEKHIRKRYDKAMLDQFESTWGSIGRLNTMLHFLLKYRYKENWDRELYENYLPITVTQLLYNVVPDTYSIEYKTHYVLPFLRDAVRKDFDIEWKHPTHLKLLLKWNEE